MKLQILLAISFDVTLALSGTLAVVRGSGPEQAGALINVVGSLATCICLMFGLAQYGPFDLATWLVDLSVLAGFFMLSVKSTRFWPIWSFGIAMADISLHLAAALLPPLAFAYVSAQVLFAYLALITLCAAIMRLPRSDRGQWSSGWRHEHAGKSRSV